MPEAEDDRTLFLEHNSQLFKSPAKLYKEAKHVSYTVDEELLCHVVLFHQALDHMQGSALQLQLLSERLFNGFPPANNTLYITHIILIVT